MATRTFKRRYEYEEGFGWFNVRPIQPNQPDEKERRYRRQKAYMAFSMIPMGLIVAIAAPFSFAFEIGPFGVVVGLVISVLMLVCALFGAAIGVFIFRDTKPIPPDPINLPRPIKITTDEEWRRPTPVRYLEDVKESIVQMEGEAVAKFKRLQNAFANITFPSGYLEYETAISHRNSFQEFRSKYEQLKESANRVYDGEVNAEINELQARVKRLQRERQELNGNYAQSQTKVRETEGKRIANAIAAARSDEIKRCIKDIDSQIIALESYISELKQIDQNLIQVKAKPTAASQSEYLAKLKREKTEKLNAMRAAGESDDAIRRWENLLDDKIASAEERLQEVL